jgi:hypothetical protein
LAGFARSAAVVGALGSVTADRSAPGVPDGVGSDDVGAVPAGRLSATVSPRVCSPLSVEVLSSFLARFQPVGATI